jgi:hypothetical protein
LIKRTFLFLVFVVLGGLLVGMGLSLLFSTFMLYDDEGYVLITLRDFSLHGGLYDQIFSQYGPAFYLIYDALHRLIGFEWSNTVGRLITLVNWSGTAVFCTLLVMRSRVSWALGLFVMADVFIYQWIMINEPMHPGSTITVLVAGTAWLGWELLHAGRIRSFAITVGLAGAVLGLIKINIGAFVVLSTGFWLVLASPTPLARHWKLALAGLGLCLPAVMMRSLLEEPWVQVFAIIAGLSIAGTVLAAESGSRAKPAGRSAWFWFLGTGLGVTLGIVVLTLARGTSLAALWEGVIVAPLKHPGIYAFPLRWRPGVLPVALAALGLVIASMRRPDDQRLILVIAWVRITAVALFQLTLLPWFSASQAAIGLCYGLPLAGLFALPLRRANTPASPADQARAWIALLFVFQSLHAYPVAGSQLNWGTFLWVPLMALGLQEALDVVLATRSAQASRRIWGGVKIGLIGLTASMLFILLSVAHNNRLNCEPLALPGAEKIGLPANINSAIRVITENARVHGDMLLSLPGGFSLNLWSGVSTPTLANATHWFSLLTPERQEAIIERMKASPRAIFVVQHNILASLLKAGFHPGGPAMEYLRASYRRAFAIEGYSFWVHKDRSIAPLSTGSLIRLPNGDPGALQMTLTLAPVDGRVACIEVWAVVGQPWKALTLNATNTRVEMTPLNLDNSPSGPARPVSWPLALSEVNRLTLSFATDTPLPPPEGLESRLMTADGRRLGAARILAPNGGELPPPVEPTP